MGIFDFFKKSKPTGRPDSAAMAAGDELAALGYFRYSDPDDVERMKRELVEGLGRV